ncbi:MAG: HAD family hydrolase [Calditrichaeota bacterium]|nr:MAG: HAD family hydrolase [Calditrichota bacterium]
MQKAVFLDRDGTIIEEMGYINHFSRIRILPGVVEAIQLFKEADYKIVVITNQAGVARGYFTEQRLKEMHAYMLELFKERKAEIDRLYYCPHHPEGKVKAYAKTCSCRKPNTGMIDQAVSDLNIDLQQSYIIGDRETDIQLAVRLKMKGIFLLTGYGVGDYVSDPAVVKAEQCLVFNDLLQAAQTIVHCQSISKDVH